MTVVADQQEPAPQPERRQITAFFCDLAGSTDLSNKLDPEDYRAALNRYIEVGIGVVDRHQGHVSRVVGDGILAFFGYPAAAEDDAERAVRAGMDLAREVNELVVLPQVHLRVRIGIATGLAIVGDLAPGQTTVAIGTPLNLAARLQEIGREFDLDGPGPVIVDTVTRRLAGGLFRYQPLGARLLDGFDQEVAAWRVSGESGGVGRFHALRRQVQLTPLVGRDQELLQLNEAWENAFKGDGSTVAVVGEAGIGKSRLIEAFLGSVDRGNTAIVRFSSYASSTNVSLRPIVTTLSQGAAFDELDDEAQRLAKLKALLSSANPSIEPTEWVPLFAELLSIDTLADPVRNDPVLRNAPVARTPDQQKERMLVAIVDYFISLSQRQPTILLFEDVHWIDPSTRDVVHRIAKGVAGTKTLMVLSARTEEPVEWLGDVATQTIRVGRLERNQAASILDAIAGESKPSAVVVEQVLDRSDGIPLFVEELTRAVVETAGTDQPGPLVERQSDQTSSTLPAVLWSALIARLDLLQSARGVAQVCAVIGREFSLGLVQAVSRVSDDDLSAAVVQLGQAGLVELVTEATEPAYRFRHALFHDATYATLLRERRQQLHSEVAATIEGRFQRLAEGEPSVLAHHLTESRQIDRAILEWQKAGRKAAAGAFHVEAASFFGTALGLLPHIPEGPDRDELELDLQLENALSVAAIRGYAAPEVEEAYARARQLSQIKEPSTEYIIIRGMCTFYIVRANTKVAEELARRCLEISDNSKEPKHVIEGHTALGYVHTKMGKFASGRDHMMKAVELYKASHTPDTNYGTSQDPAVACLSYLSHADWITGDRDLALSHRDEALRLAERIDPFSLAFAHSYVSMLDHLLGDYKSAESQADRAIAIGTEHGFLLWIAVGTVHRAIARGHQGDLAYGIEALTTAVANFRAGGAETDVPFFLGALADLKRKNSDHEGALQAVDEGIDIARAHSEGAWLAMLLAKRGRILAQLGRPAADVEEAFSSAISLARQQGAKQFESDANQAMREFAEGAIVDAKR